MTPGEIRWQSVDRSALPKALFGKRPDGLHASRLQDALIYGHGVALGYAEQAPAGGYCPPALLAVDDNSGTEVLSWLRAYAPETFPLNQFARVVLRSDWERLSMPRLWNDRSTPRADLWASVVLGELVAQGDLDSDLTNIPLSWYVSCFSAAVARTTILYSADEEIGSCIERLRSVELDESFSRRSVSVEDLRPIWALAQLGRPDSFGAREAAELVLRGLTKISEEPYAAHELANTILNEQSAFLSDSIEGRVLAFQQLAARVLDRFERVERPSSLVVACLAVGAFLVGRGTSHAFLITRLGRKWTQAHIWLGLLGGLAGPGAWDQTWSLAVKGIERLLRRPFDWSGTSGADLSWAEYSWVSRTFVGKGVFSGLPKLLPRQLTVELLPGVACQLRLVGDSSAVAREKNRLGTVELERSNLELKDTLDKLAALTARARNIVAVRTHAQTQLPLGVQDSQPEREPPPRKRKRP